MDNAVFSDISKFKFIDNYIYLYHIDKFIILPTWPESIQDSLSSTFAQSNPLARSAPIFSYTNSGPRTVQVSLSLHREMMSQINYGVSNINVEIDDDYVDTLVKQIQAIALPAYASPAKMVNPPLIAVRFGNEIFIKGVVQGGISITYSGPILDNNKYAQIQISFTVSEIDPYDAESISKYGSFRGLNKTLERTLYKR